MLCASSSSLLIAMRMVRRNKLRAGLTVIGITIGIAAVVTMIALGQGARASRLQLGRRAWGPTPLFVFPQSARRSGAKDNSAGSRLSELDCDALPREATSIHLCAPFMRASAQAVYEGQNAKTSVIGSRLSYFAVRNLKVVKGEQWTARGRGHQREGLRASARPPRASSTAPATRWAACSASAATPTACSACSRRRATPRSARIRTRSSSCPSPRCARTCSRRAPSTSTGSCSAPPAPRPPAARRSRSTDILRQRHHINDGDEDDFVVRSPGRAAEPARGHLRRALGAPRRHRRRLARRRRHRRDEHHARLA